MTIGAVMKRILVAAALSAVFVAESSGAVMEIGKATLLKDTTWEGEVLVTGDVHVPEGVTLTVSPGTVVKFRKLSPGSDRNLFGTDSPYYEQSEIIVTGRLVARGTAARPVVFTSGEAAPQAGDWSALNFLGSRGNVVENCVIDYAYNAVHAHGAEVLIRNNVFRNCAVAISVKKEDEAKGTPGFGIPADIAVVGNLIEHNKGGINVRVSKAMITGNTIRDNKFFGIWIKGSSPGEIRLNDITANQKGIFFYKAAGMTITANNIYGNVDYDLAVADEQAKDIVAAGNWLGTTDPVKIGERVFDGRADPSVAKILVEPVLTERVKGAGRQERLQ